MSGASPPAIVPSTERSPPIERSPPAPSPASSRACNPFQLHLGPLNFGPFCRRASPVPPAGPVCDGWPGWWRRWLPRAAALLRNTDRSVAEICLDVGLASVGSFTTSFKRNFGKTPTAYRASYPPASAWAVVPGCVVRANARPRKRTLREDSPPAGS